MSIFLEVLCQIDAKLKQMTEQVETIRWQAISGRFEAAYQHSLSLEDNLERATLLGRALPAYTGEPAARRAVAKIIKQAHPVEIGYTPDGWFTLRLPMLLPKKETGSTEFIRGFLYPAMQAFFQDKEPVRYPDCVMIFRHVYSRDRPERQWRDHDNIEVNIVADIVALYTMPDDNPNVCTHYYCSAAGEQERTEVYVVPKDDFKIWLTMGGYLHFWEFPDVLFGVTATGECSRYVAVAKVVSLQGQANDCNVRRPGRVSKLEIVCNDA